MDNSLCNLISKQPLWLQKPMVDSFKLQMSLHICNCGMIGLRRKMMWFIQTVAWTNLFLQIPIVLLKPSALTQKKPSFAWRHMRWEKMGLTEYKWLDQPQFCGDSWHCCRKGHHKPNFHPPMVVVACPVAVCLPPHLSALAIPASCAHWIQNILMTASLQIWTFFQNTEGRRLLQNPNKTGNFVFLLIFQSSGRCIWDFGLTNQNYWKKHRN